MSRLYTTSVGAEMIGESPEVQDIIERFMDPSVPSGLVTSPDTLVGEGDYGQVYAVGDVAVKISSANHCQGRGTQPENLILQLRFMSALSSYLKEGGANVFAPAQYFAARNSSGDHILGYQLMRDWQPVHSWMMDNHKIDGINTLNTVSRAIKKRVVLAVGPAMLRAGVNDLNSSSMHGAHNVMVPVSADNPTESPLCIIDQPKRSIFGHAIAALMPKVDTYS